MCDLWMVRVTIEPNSPPCSFTDSDVCRQRIIIIPQKVLNKIILVDQTAFVNQDYIINTQTFQFNTRHIKVSVLRLVNSFHMIQSQNYMCAPLNLIYQTRSFKKRMQGFTSPLFIQTVQVNQEAVEKLRSSSKLSQPSDSYTKRVEEETFQNMAQFHKKKDDDRPTCYFYIIVITGKFENTSNMLNNLST